MSPLNCSCVVCLFFFLWFFGYPFPCPAFFKFAQVQKDEIVNSKISYIEVNERKVCLKKISKYVKESRLYFIDESLLSERRLEFRQSAIIVTLLRIRKYIDLKKIVLTKENHCVEYRFVWPNYKFWYFTLCVTLLEELHLKKFIESITPRQTAQHVRKGMARFFLPLLHSIPAPRTLPRLRN